jgi:predicted flap endonuclease-1-like 5' DNA nuclease
MPYTLTVVLWWYLLALAMGLALGWVLRSASASRQVERARRRQQAADGAELEELRERTSRLERVAEERDRLKNDLEQLRASTERAEATGPRTEPVAGPDLEVGAVVLGRAIRLDDLRAISGIGPAIEGLCHGIGIRTWWDLATTDVPALRAMLTDAGPRFGMHDPTTWPQQARLLAEGRWEEFRALEARIAARGIA